MKEETFLEAERGRLSLILANKSISSNIKVTIRKHSWETYCASSTLPEGWRPEKGIIKEESGFLSLHPARYDAQPWKVGFQIGVYPTKAPGGTGKAVKMIK